MSKFKKGDWVLHSVAKVGKDMRCQGYYVYDVLPNGCYVLELNPGEYGIWAEAYLEGATVEPRCTGWDWVLPEPAETFGLKVGDTVTIQNYGLYEGDYSIKAIVDDYRDGTARFELEGDAGGPWHPYWFGLCDMGGKPLPPKPVVEVWSEYVVITGNTGHSKWYVGSTTPPFTDYKATGRTVEIPKGENP